jgi:Flp pilus assembly pilin Flp
MLRIVLELWRDLHGQDLIEYALMAGFLAVGIGVSTPGLVDQIADALSRVASVLGLVI